MSYNPTPQPEPRKPLSERIERLRPSLCGADDEDFDMAAAEVRALEQRLADAERERDTFKRGAREWYEATRKTDEERLAEKRMADAAAARLAEEREAVAALGRSFDAMRDRAIAAEAALAAAERLADEHRRGHAHYQREAEREAVERKAAEARVAALEVTLRQVQWCGVRDEAQEPGEVDVLGCPVCPGNNHDGHEGNCPIGSVLSVPSPAPAPASGGDEPVLCGTFSGVETPRGEVASPDWAAFGRQLRDMREKFGFSMGQLARQLGCTVPALSSIEVGRVPKHVTEARPPLAAEVADGYPRLAYQVAACVVEALDQRQGNEDYCGENFIPRAAHEAALAAVTAERDAARQALAVAKIWHEWHQAHEWHDGQPRCSAGCECERETRNGPLCRDVWHRVRGALVAVPVDGGCQ